MSIRLILAVSLFAASFSAQASDDMFADNSDHAEFACYVQENGVEQGGKVYIDIDGKVDLNVASEIILLQPSVGAPLFKTMVTSHSVASPRCTKAPCPARYNFEIMAPDTDEPAIKLSLITNGSNATLEVMAPAEAKATLRCEPN
jgi:hypothetical protein